MINFEPGVTVTTARLGPDSDSLWVAPPNTTIRYILYCSSYCCTGLYWTLYSRLRINHTAAKHAGNYTCAPQNLVTDTIRLSISTGQMST